MKKNKPDAMIIDDFGNIYYSAASLNELKQKYKEELTLEKNAYNRMYNMYVKEKEKKDKAIELLEWVNKMKIKFTNYNSKEKDYIDTLLDILKGEDKSGI